MFIFTKMSLKYTPRNQAMTPARPKVQKRSIHRLASSREGILSKHGHDLGYNGMIKSLGWLIMAHESSIEIIGPYYKTWDDLWIWISMISNHPTRSVKEKIHKRCLLKQTKTFVGYCSYWWLNSNLGKNLKKQQHIRWVCVSRELGELKKISKNHRFPLIHSYCWWTKSQTTTWDAEKNPINNRIIIILGGAGSRSCCEVATPFLFASLSMSPPRVDQSSSLATSTRRRPARPGFFQASFNTVKTHGSPKTY